MLLLCLSCATADLGEQQINTEGGVLIIQVAFEFGDLLPQHIWSISDLYDPSALIDLFFLRSSYSANNTKTASIRDCGSQSWTSSHVHAGKHDWVLDLQQIGRCCSERLWGRHRG